MIPPDLLAALGQRLLTASWQASLLVLCVLGLRRILAHRLAPKWRHALWWPVLLRLVLPFTPPSDVSLYRLLPALHPAASSAPQSLPAPRPGPPSEAAWTASARVAARESDPWNPGFPASSQAFPAATHPLPSLDPDSGVPAVTPPDAGNSLGSGHTMPATAVPALASAQSSAARPPLLRRLPTALFVLWALGVIGVLLPPALGLRRLFRHVHSWPEHTTDGALELWRKLHGHLGIRTLIPMAEARELSGPALLGLLKPILLLPKGLVEKLFILQLL